MTQTMKYDPNKYRELGVGERIHAHHFYGNPVTGLISRVTPNFINTLVSDEDAMTFLEALTPEIAKDTFPTGAQRSAAEGRGRFDLIPYEAMLSLAKRYELGAKHFGDRNWEKGQPLSRLLSSLRRHAHQIGFDFSEDHAGAVLWNAAAFVTMVERMRAGILPKELDDIGFFMSEEGSKR